MPDDTVNPSSHAHSQKADSDKVSGVNATHRPALDARYGQIGISAVAAAARYQGTAKNPAYAPAPNDGRAYYPEEPA